MSPQELEALRRYMMEHLHYDPETGIFTRRKGIQSRAAGAIAGHPNQGGYLAIGLNYKTYRAHRLAWLYMTGKYPEQDIDHINGVKTDNRFCNLRDVSGTVNMQNIIKPRKNNKCGYRGVCFRNGKYIATIRAGDKTFHIGKFESVEEAHEAYVREKIKRHPGFAQLNGEANGQ